MPTRDKRPEFSVVVPVYENTSSIQELVDRTAAVFEDVLKTSYEIVLVDDGSSRTPTWEGMQQAAKGNKHVKTIRLMRNYGKPAAVLCGLAHARGSWVVTIDDDLQQRPEDIAALAEFKQHDVVVAVYPKKQHGIGVRITSAIKSWFDRRVLKIPIRMSPLKLIKGEIVSEMLRIRTGRPFIPALLVHATTDFWAVSLNHEASAVKKSRYSFLRRLRQFSDLIIGNSSFLLRMMAALGFFCAAAGILLGLFSLVQQLSDSADSITLRALFAVNLFLGGMILLGLGVVGEYLRRIIDLSSAKPAYLIREVRAGGKLVDAEE